jgi:adenosylmethionine-8-amino-7-oxononanoate aminotransferase
MGKALKTLLKANNGPLEFVGDIRGRGLFWAVEFVQDTRSKTPFPASMRLCHRIVDKALELGLNILGKLGVTGDVHVDHVIISPLYVVTKNELDHTVGILQEAIKSVTSEVVKALEACLSTSKST